MIKISNRELIKELSGQTTNFPLYTSQIINLANQNAQGTRPAVVGKLSELIQECPEKTYEGWKKWYLEKHPQTIEHATQKIEAMVNKLREAILLINKDLIKDWVENLVLEKTFIGLKFQEAILKKIATLQGTTYRLAAPQEESHGIDGFLGEVPISIKPITYKTKPSLQEKIPYPILFYEKKKDGIEIDDSQIIKSDANTT